MPGALDGILVVDLSRVLAGPLVAMTLGDLGADVIKVESPDGDDTRRWSPPADAQGRAAYHHAANRNKRSIVLDLKTRRPTSSSRAGSASAPTSSSRTSSRARSRASGSTTSRSRARTRGVIHCEISGFGERGGAAHARATTRSSRRSAG